MEIKIQAVKFTATEKLEAYINKKLQKLSKLNDDIVFADVFLKVTKPESAENKEVEIKIQTKSGDFYASKTSNTFEESTDMVIDALEKQLEKHKEKLRNK